MQTFPSKMTRCMLPDSAAYIRCSFLSLIFVAVLSVLIYLPILYLRVPQTVFPLQATGDENDTNRNGSRR